MVLKCVGRGRGGGGLELHWPCVLLLPDPGRNSWSWSDTWTGDSSPGNDPDRREQTGRLRLLLLRMLLHGVSNRYRPARIATTDSNRPASSHWHLLAANHRNQKREVVTPALDTHLRPVPVKTQVQQACTGRSQRLTWSQTSSHFFSLSYWLKSFSLSGGKFMVLWRGETRRKAVKLHRKKCDKSCDFISVTLNLNVFWRLGCWS